MRADLPTGTVTFCFTDVEGSTRLLHSLGAEAYAQALAEHRALIREACSAQGGVEVDTQGDAFFFAFPTAAGALAAAASFTAALAAGPISVRVGLHTGSPLLDAEGYVGADVHLAARIASAAHGGQVVCSQATAALLGAEPKAASYTLSQGFELRPLGAHRLKDVSEPLALYQLGEGSFPPLTTIANTNLPTPASSFLGRETELDEADALLQGTRLLTITGPGGAGKTRFCLELATRAREERFRDYRDGVYSAFLSSLRDPALVLATLCQTLSVHEQPGESALAALASHLAGKRMLLLLDNAEHLLACAAELSELLERSPGLTLLVSSRELLRIRGETPYALPPLPADTSLALLCERARVEPSPALRELAVRLEGLPLALELAAARLAILTPAQLLERLASRLDLLKAGRDADPRQQTLRATIEWSYDLLTPQDQRLFRSLSVFSGGCTLEAAEEVAEADLDSLHSLVDKSLLRVSAGRFWMLETIREYAGERLQVAGEADAIRERHALHYLAVAESAEAVGPEASSADRRRRVRDEHDNMRLALTWLVQRHEADRALRLVCALGDHWVVGGHLFEARSHAQAALALPGGQSPEVRARALAAGSDFARLQGDIEGARVLSEESLALSRDVGDQRGVARALHELGESALAEEDFDKAVELFQEAVAAARAAGHNGAGSIGNMGYVALLSGDYERAVTLSEEAIQLFRQRGHESGVAVGFAILADAELLLGRTDEARLRTKESLELGRAMRFKEVVASSLDTTAELIVAGEAALAARLTGAADALREDIRLSQSPAERRLHHRTHATLRSTLGADVVDDLRGEGRLLDMDDAIALALEALG